jgi:hypothetical protein
MKSQRASKAKAWKAKREGKRPGLNQNHFPGCVLEAFEYLDAWGEKRLHYLWDAK